MHTTIAAEIMSSPAVTVHIDSTAQQAAALLTENHVGVAPVVDDQGMLVGMINEAQLLAGIHRNVRDLMSTALVIVSPDTPVSNIRHLLIDQRIRCVPVMEQGRPIGIVGRRHVLALLATEWVCRTCGEPARGETPPTYCPRCHATVDHFEIQEQLPGA